MSRGLDYPAIIAQLQTCANNVFRYVTYAISPQDILNLDDDPDITLYPVAYVSPQGIGFGPDRLLAGDYRAMATERFSIAVVWRNQGDALAQQSAANLTLYRETLWAALLNWRPLAAQPSRPVVATGDELFALQEGARSVWLFQFEIEYQVVSSDGYVPPATANGVVLANAVATFG